MAEFGRTLQLFLVDGTPSELMIASIHGWTGSLLVASQGNFAKLLARPEVERTGIYILFGPDPDDPMAMRAYVGEADDVGERLKTSTEKRGFWETAVVVTTSDEALTKGHVRYLEARLLRMAREAGRVRLDNEQILDPEKRRLPEADRANMEAFLANLRVVLPVVGVELLKPRPVAVQAGAAAGEPGQTRFEIRHKSGVKALAVEEGGEFIVLAGSQAYRGAKASAHSYVELKQELIARKILAPGDAPDILVFQHAHAFRSVSAAAAVVLDRSSNGRREWKVEGGTTSYHEWQLANA